MRTDIDHAALAGALAATANGVLSCTAAALLLGASPAVVRRRVSTADFLDFVAVEDPALREALDGHLARLRDRARTRAASATAARPPAGGKAPGEPCPYPPGSPGKVAALEARARLGQCLWHPLDAAGDPLGTPGLPPPGGDDTSQYDGRPRAPKHLFRLAR